MKPFLSLLNSYKNKLNFWWRGLADKERFYLIILGVTTVIIIGYYMVISPINNALSTLQQQINYQQTIINKITPQVTEIKSLQDNRGITIVSTTNLLPTIDQSLKDSGLRSFTTELSQSGNNAVQIKFNDIPFDRAISWMIDLWKNYHIQVSKIDTQRTETIGNVNILVILSVN